MPAFTSPLRQLLPLFFMVALGLFLLLSAQVNKRYSPAARDYQLKVTLLQAVHLASPALASAGRNIAFESSNMVANAPASYLAMLDCCESDEAIVDRLAVGQTRCTIRKKEVLP